MGWTDLQSQHLGCRNRSRSSLATQQVGGQPVSKQPPKHLQKPLHPTRYAGEQGTVHSWLSSHSWEHEWQTGIPTVPSPCFLTASLAEDRDDWAVQADLLSQARRPLWWMTGSKVLLQFGWGYLGIMLLKRNLASFAAAFPFSSPALLATWAPSLSSPLTLASPSENPD